jgi:hypothetical protein
MTMQNKTLDALHFGASSELGIFAAAVVATGMVLPDGSLFDWTAYAGGYPAQIGRDAGAELVARSGDKLSRHMAAAIFNLPADKYRE